MLGNPSVKNLKIIVSGLPNPVGYGGSSSGSSGWLITGGYNMESKILDSVYLLKVQIKFGECKGWPWLYKNISN